MKTRMPPTPQKQAEATIKALADRLAASDKGMVERALVNLAELFVGQTADCPDDTTKRATVCIIVDMALDTAAAFDPKTAPIQ